MPGLGETTAMLARLRRAAEGTAGQDGLMARTRAFGSNPGQLAMLSYRPDQLASGAPLVVVLHGCTQTGEAYAANAGWLDLADRLGFAVLAPEQSPSNNPNRCFNWFSPQDVTRESGEVASIAAMVVHMLAEHDLDPARVFVTGLSAGGAMTAAMLATYPELFAGGAVIAGLPYGVARNVQGALSVMGRGDGRAGPVLGALVPKPAGGVLPRLSIWHGDADATVQVGNARDLARQWASACGLSEAPHSVEPEAHATRSTWRAEGRDGDGEALIELNILPGLGHGTPLATKTTDAVGKVAPYMLEAGVASSVEIARFWKIDQGARGRKGASAQKPSPSAGAPSGAGLGHGVMAAIAHIPANVQDVVANALRRAGLLK